MSAERTVLRELLRSADDAPTTEALSLPSKVRFRSGRMLQLCDGSDGRAESVSMSSPDGAIELTVRFGADGLELSFADARIALRQVSELTLDCERLRLSAAQGVVVSSGADLQIEGRGAVKIDGDSVLINCEDRARAPR